jgi:hypothetical protein
MATKYKKKYCPRRRNTVNERVLIAEEALGKMLPAGCEIFDYNGQLVICQDRAYNRLLHGRAKSYEVYGAADIRKCHICGEDDLEEKLYFPKSGGQYHQVCHLIYCHETQQNKQYRQSQLYCQRGHWIEGRNKNQRYCKICAKESFDRYIGKKKEEKDDRSNKSI